MHAMHFDQPLLLLLSDSILISPSDFMSSFSFCFFITHWVQPAAYVLMGLGPPTEAWSTYQEPHP